MLKNKEDSQSTQIKNNENLDKQIEETSKKSETETLNFDKSQFEEQKNGLKVELNHKPNEKTIKEANEIWDLYYRGWNNKNKYLDFAGKQINKEKYFKEWNLDHIIPKSKCDKFKQTNLIPNFSKDHEMNLQPTSILTNESKADQLSFSIDNVQYKVYYNEKKNIKNRFLFCGKVSQYDKHVKTGKLIDVEAYLNKFEEEKKEKIKNKNKNQNKEKQIQENKLPFINSLFSNLSPKFAKNSYSVTAFSIKFTDLNFFNFFTKLKEILSTTSFSFNNFLIKTKPNSYFLHIYSERFLDKSDKICPNMLADFLKLIVQISKIEDFENYVCKQFFWSYDFSENELDLHKKISEIWDNIPHLFWKQCIQNQKSDKFFINQKMKEILSEHYQVNSKSLNKISDWYKLDDKFFNN